MESNDIAMNLFLCIPVNRGMLMMYVEVIIHKKIKRW